MELQAKGTNTASQLQDAAYASLDSYGSAGNMVGILPLGCLLLMKQKWFLMVILVSVISMYFSAQDKSC